MKKSLAVCTMAAVLGYMLPAAAQVKLKVSEDVSISMGIGIRATYISTENAAPNGSSYSKTFNAEHVSPYFLGEFGKFFKTFLHFDRGGGPAAAGGENLRLLDGVAQFDFRDDFHLWLGRMLLPTDRANLYGRFYSFTWYPPEIAGRYPGIFGGRDSGAMVWGNLLQNHLTYSVGAFNGHNRAAGLSNASNSLLYATRIDASFWDPEPGYYRPSSYVGKKDILSVGAAAQRQSRGAGTAARSGTLSIWSLDGLLEKKLPGGYVPSFEAIYWHYGLGGAVDCGSGEPGSVACPAAADNVGGLVAGKSYSVTGLLLFPQKIGWGQFQPFVRHQKFSRDLSGTTNSGTDLGLNYVIDGFNARVSAIYTRSEDTRNPLMTPALPATTKQFLLGVQFQY